MSSDLIDADEWIDVITVPDDGDEYVAASVEGAFQALANRTFNLLGRLNAFDSIAHTWAEFQTFAGGHVKNSWGITGEILYCDDDGVPETRPRTEMVPLTDGVLSANVTGVVSAVLVSVSGTGGYWYWPATSGQVTFPVRAPRGSTITSVRVGVSNQSGSPAAMTAYLLGKAANKISPSASSESAVATDSATIAAGADRVFTLAPSGIPLVVNNGTSEITVSVDGQVDCRIHWVELNYADPGPRNG